MPHVNLYVRQDDWEAFEAIPDKPAWLHRSIQAAKTSIKGMTTTPYKPATLNPEFRQPARLEEVETHYEPVDDLP